MALGQTIKRLRKDRGWTLDQLAEASGVDVGTINALENRDSARSKYAPNLAAAFRIPLEALFETTPTQVGEEQPPRYSGAQELSQPQLTVVPVIPWERLMSSKLPPRFEIEMPDDSMAPRVRAGQPVTLSTTETPRPGDGVLVSDRSGRCYLRIYRQRTPDSWQAHALNEAFDSLDSDRDGLEVQAVLVGVPARWG